MFGFYCLISNEKSIPRNIMAGTGSSRFKVVNLLVIGLCLDHLIWGSSINNFMGNLEVHRNNKL